MKRMMIVMMMIVLLSLCVAAQERIDTTPEDVSGEDMDIIKTKLKKIINILQYIAGFIAAIASIVASCMTT